MDILDHFVSSKEFKKHSGSYTEETVNMLRHLIKKMHEQGLDWYTTDKDKESNFTIRCGRKETTEKKGKTFLLINPKKNHLAVQANNPLKRSEALIKGKLDERFLLELEVSNLSQQFSVKSPTKNIRIGYMPQDY